MILTSKKEIRKHYKKNWRALETMIRNGFPAALVCGQWICSTELADEWFEKQIAEKIAIQEGANNED